MCNHDFPDNGQINGHKEVLCCGRDNKSSQLTNIVGFILGNNVVKLCCKKFTVILQSITVSLNILRWHRQIKNLTVTNNTVLNRYVSFGAKCS